MHHPILIPVILCGGMGSRLWPISRQNYPKPFIKLDNEESLLQKSYRLALALPNCPEIITVTQQQLHIHSQQSYENIGADKENTFILEPCGRNTAPAVACATQLISQKYGLDTLVLILAADHLIEDHEGFIKCVDQASTAANNGKISLFGIKPTRPETGYGYINTQSKPIAFHEKPDESTAKKWLESGEYLWNSGMFCFSTGTLLDELKKYSPSLLKKAQKSLTNSTIFDGVVSLPDAFSELPNESIDCAIMEQCENLAVIQCNVGWSDIGSWTTFTENLPMDAQGNRSNGSGVFENSTNCSAYTSKRTVALVGLEDVIVVDTDDAVLVTHKGEDQNVKKLYQRLSDQQQEVALNHQTVHRPWGTYTVLEEGPRFKMKKIVVKPGGKLSLQMHHHRNEHWVVVSGSAQVTRGQEHFLLSANESTYISAGELHRLENPGLMDLIIIEVQCGEYLGEDDIVRFDDIYGRVAESEEETT